LSMTERLVVDPDSYLEGSPAAPAGIGLVLSIFAARVLA
jgi:hypothetical protein